MQKIQIVIWAVVMLAGAGRVHAALTWDIYNDAVIDEVGDFYGRVHIYDTAPEHTSVNMVGGRVDLMATYDSSTLNVTAGDISTAAVMESSTLNVSGRAKIKSAQAHEFGTVNISGGDVFRASASACATVNISGGAAVGDVTLYRSASLNVTGGVLEKLVVSGRAVANVRGGSVGGIVPRHSFDGLVNIYGDKLVKSDLGGSYGYGEVSGIYPDGSEFVIDLGRGIYPHVNLIPEPATLLLFSVGSLIVRGRILGDRIRVKMQESRLSLCRRFELSFGSL